MKRVGPAVIFWLFGLYLLAASVKDWDFFFESRKARPFVGIFGRNGARILYGVLGAFGIMLGFVCLFSK